MSNVIKVWNYCSVDDAMIVEAPAALPVEEAVQEETMTAEEMEELHKAQSLKDRSCLMRKLTRKSSSGTRCRKLNS